MLVSTRAATHFYLTGVPDYDWYAGCFGAASGNLMGYWDRHGLPDLYTGPTGNGVAPLNSFGTNVGIRSMWASRAGLDGRPTNLFGHTDDYYVAFQSTDPDPYLVAHRPEHTPDCIGDFMGLSQNKWTNLNNECNGNIDGYSFVYWDGVGDKRVNFTPSAAAGLPAIDIQSGLRAWTKYRGYSADVFTQLSDFNPTVQPGKGFTFADLIAEIQAGYPVILFLQPFDQFSRVFPGQSRGNPDIHGMLAYGYLITDDGSQYVLYRTSWASGDNQFSQWHAEPWTPDEQLSLPLRGVIGFHPLPQIVSTTMTNNNLTLRWDGPASELYDAVNRTTQKLHSYVVEKSASLNGGNFTAVAPATTEHQLTLTNCCSGSAFFRVRLVRPP